MTTGRALGIVVLVAEPQPAETDPYPGAAPCSSCDCLQGKCKFSVPRVRFYLHILRQAQIVREDPVEVLRDSARSSRPDEPWLRGNKFDSDDARSIILSVIRARDEGGIPLAGHNAERIAGFCCPLRWNED